MMQDVTFGQYYPTDSFVHRLDPRTKLLFLIGFIVAIFLIPIPDTLGDFIPFVGIAVCAAVLFLAIFAANVPFKSVFRSVKGILFLLIFTALLNVFFYAGEHTVTIGGVALEFGILKITVEGIIFAIFMACRLFMLVMSSTVLTLTTAPVTLTDGLESLLSPLNKIHFPVHVLALIMSIALRFIPKLMEETDRIMNAQKARGADFEHGSIASRVKAIVPVLIPLLLSAFRIADELGTAMEARCYVGDGDGVVRTKYKKLTYGKNDLLAGVVCVALLVGVILLKVFTA